jgi:hypothetical protein
MKTPIKYMILLLVGGIIIPLYQLSGTTQTVPVITPVKNAKFQASAKGENLHETSFVMYAATKLLPVLKYF